MTIHNDKLYRPLIYFTFVVLALQAVMFGTVVVIAQQQAHNTQQVIDTAHCVSRARSVLEDARTKHDLATSTVLSDVVQYGLNDPHTSADQRSLATDITVTQKENDQYDSLVAARYRK